MISEAKQIRIPNVCVVLLRQKALAAIVFMLVLMTFFKTNFYTSYNLLDVLNSTSINMILAAGVTLVLICGGCDFSIGGMLSLSGILTIKMMEVMPILPAMIISIVAGIVVGFINGFLVVHQKTEAFVITLGMGMLLKGIAQVLTEARPIAPPSYSFMEISNGKVMGFIPNLVIILIIVIIIFHILLTATSFGRNCYAVGGNYEVAVYSGINAMRVKWTAYIICGAMASIGGVLLSSKLNSGSSIYGDSTALFVNCGAVVGGTSFSGGKGGIVQTFSGLLVLVLLQNVMNMLTINAYIQQVVEGCVIVGIIWLDCFALKCKREAV